MLILAGVSLNALVGDNGIISTARDTTIKDSIAILEEFIQREYVENYDSFNNDESRVDQLQNIDAYRKYFYIPKDEGIGSLNYISYVSGENVYALYLIKKSGLPRRNSRIISWRKCR